MTIPEISTRWRSTVARPAEERTRAVTLTGRSPSRILDMSQPGWRPAERSNLPKSMKAAPVARSRADTRSRGSRTPAGASLETQALSSGMGGGGDRGDGGVDADAAADPDPRVNQPHQGAVD